MLELNNLITPRDVNGLDNNIIENIEHAQLLGTQWQWIYNNERPYSKFVMYCLGKNCS